MLFRMCLIKQLFRICGYKLCSSSVQPIGAIVEYNMCSGRQQPIQDINLSAITSEQRNDYHM